MPFLGMAWTHSLQHRDAEMCGPFVFWTSKWIWSALASCELCLESKGSTRATTPQQFSENQPLWLIPNHPDRPTELEEGAGIKDIIKFSTCRHLQGEDAFTP